MDTKKVLHQLLKIAENQQKIIMKLAQGQLPPDSLPTSQVGVSGGHGMPVSQEPPPQDLSSKQQHVELQKKVLSINPKLANVIASIVYGQPGFVNVSFKPGQANQANYEAVRSAVGAAGVKAQVHVV